MAGLFDKLDQLDERLGTKRMMARLPWPRTRRSQLIFGFGSYAAALLFLIARVVTGSYGVGALVIPLAFAALILLGGAFGGPAKLWVGVAVGLILGLNLGMYF